jgi:nucleoside-diphosphate-sugar epimerase
VPTAFVTGGSGFIGGHLLRRLIGEGWTVKALARSETSAGKVAAAGAEPIRGSLADEAALGRGVAGAEVVFHAAAKVADWGDWEEFRRVNVGGTESLLAASAAAGARRFVHVGTEAVLLRGQPLVYADERTPLAYDSPSRYAATKALAETAVLAARGVETIVIRPRFVWGPGDTTLVPVMLELIEHGQFRWIGGGHHLTSTTHVDNCVEGLMLAAKRGTPGAAYFVTDGAPVVFREFVTSLLATRDVVPPGGTVPRRAALGAAQVAEAAWRLLPLTGEPPLTRFGVWFASIECTLDDSRGRADLGYAPITSRADGLAALHGGGSPL